MKEAEKGYLPYHRNEKYPRSLTVDFRKLSEESLRTYIARYRLNVRVDATHTELAVAVAQHFEGIQVDEESVLGRFFECLDRASNREDEDEDMEDEDEENVAKCGEQVAAKVTMVDENGSWILASVVSYSKHNDTYQVQDEDEATAKIIELPSSRIRRLYEDDADAHDLQKGDRVLAIFPETTSFYRAVVSKTPKRNATGSVTEVVLKFEDDEDDAGRTPHRRVNIRYVLREQRPSVAQGGRRPGPATTNLGGGGAPSFGGGGGGGSAGGSSGPAAPGGEPGRGGDDRMDTSGGEQIYRQHAPAATATTYSDMIARALEKLPGERGNFKEICAVIEDDFSEQLNWKLESDVRKTPVWKSSVRKILFSNARFCNTNTNDKNVFGFAAPKQPAAAQPPAATAAAATNNNAVVASATNNGHLTNGCGPPIALQASS
ncbi:hypothetical protein CTAYLR_000015 [Chrysophaeum taylorii]|uniref:SGF29 C-terminal domain-containing protein n=1 Tax=Chrysophaeum taylorii TaxID=2483200 RepID=A0AAD7UHC1_9STRA|nr:hypothetical protein CTAYLR_000015 [Chrysophaeum taylorii]